MHTNNIIQCGPARSCKRPSLVTRSRACDCPGGHLRLRDELRDLLAGVEGSHLHVGDAPVGAAGRVQDLVMLLQDFAETGEVQVLRRQRQGEEMSEARSALPRRRARGAGAVLRPGSSAAG